MSDAIPLLTAEDFDEFYRAIHDNPPFPWQSSLVAHVLESRRWPDLVDVPTGLGKTSMIDIAVFIGAATSHIKGVERLGRRRCFFVVDRRIVVDEAFDHAQRLSNHIQNPASAAVEGVADRLRIYLRPPKDSPDVLLPVTRMRGGTTWDAAWLDRPDRPGIVLGTVDQIGSRMLFRGYGVSDRRKPIDAALVGTDSLVLIDEAHLATALTTTMSAAQQRDRLGVSVPGVDFVQLSATGTSTASTFELDVDAHKNNRFAWQRLTAGKRLVTATATAKNCPAVMASTAIDYLVELGGEDSSDCAPTALIVCNTVDRARAVHTQLSKILIARNTPIAADCELLIGRSRPLDRLSLQTKILDRFGVNRPGSDRAAILVATQTVEVGVNLDTDMLVTESTSWDAIVQRLGRLNRLGTHSERFPGREAALAVVVHDGQAESTVYGTSRDATWEALCTLGDGIDVSPLGCRKLTETVFAEPRFIREPGDVPVLLGPTLDAWTHTSPIPMNDPPVDPFLHGFDTGVAPIQVVWRDGLVSVDPLDDPSGHDDPERASIEIDALLTQLPPRTSELVEVPFGAVRQWMSGQAAAPITDLESAPDLEIRTAREGKPFRVLAQRNNAQAREKTGDRDTPLQWRWIDAEELWPGDRIVVPTERGGLDRYGWAPADSNPVSDGSEAATFTASRSKKPAVLLLDNRLPHRLGIDDVASAATLIDELFADTDVTPITSEIKQFARRLGELLPDAPPEHSPWNADTDGNWPMLRQWLQTGNLRLIEMMSPVVQANRNRTVIARILSGPVDRSTADQEEIVRDDEEIAASSVNTGPVTLAVHHAAVRERAEAICEALGLPTALSKVVGTAAGWHDLGKLDPRFQAMLHGGDKYAAMLAIEPLAKSGMDPSDRMAWRRACVRSKLPPGARHEAWSAALVEEYLEAVDYSGDTDLLIHLIASHHGYSRPFARLVSDQEPQLVQATIDGETVTVSSEKTVALDHPDRFARLNERYGRWGLALLESIVRCADMTVSGEGS